MSQIQNSRFEIRNSNSQSVDPLMRKVTRKIRARLPDAEAVIFFGSRVAGVSDAFSDYDVLVLLPEGLEFDERKRVKQEMQAAFPDVKLDLVFGSERWLLANLNVEAYYRFWLENGIATFGCVPKVHSYPLLYKDAVESRLNIIRSEIRVFEVGSRNLHQEARGYLSILKELVLIEHALMGDYSAPSLWEDIESLLGKDMLVVLRDPGAVRKVRQPMLRQVRRVMRRKLSEVQKLLAHSQLPYKYPPRQKPIHAKTKTITQNHD